MFHLIHDKPNNHDRTQPLDCCVCIWDQMYWNFFFEKKKGKFKIHIRSWSRYCSVLLQFYVKMYVCQSNHVKINTTLVIIRFVCL